MNKQKLQKFADRAGLERGGYANTPEKIMTWRESFDNPGALDRFAELIINDVLNIVSDRDALDIYEEIREHFGVEE